MISLPGIFHIGQEAFSGCTKLVSAYFKRTVWDYNPDTTPPEAGTEPATSHVDGVISNKAFANCTSLKTIEAPYFKTLKEEVFKKCTSLSSISLPRITTVGEKAFIDCTSLTYVSLPKCTTLAKNAFTGCNQLISINIGTNSTSNIFSAKTTL
jgi:hypothetical protein